RRRTGRRGNACGGSGRRTRYDRRCDRAGSDPTRADPAHAARAHFVRRRLPATGFDPAAPRPRAIPISRPGGESGNAPASQLTPTSGAWRERAHLFPVRVYYEDTDAGGMVYHANYLRFAERARTEMLRTLGVELSRTEEVYGMLFVLHGGEVQYRKPA